jgi:CRP-like cAMP-binding protein
MAETSSRARHLPLRRAWRDRIALAAVAASAFAFSRIVDVHGRLHRWTDEHPRFDVYQELEFVAAVAAMSLAYLVVTRLRLRREVVIKQEREDALTKALHEIEVLSGLLAMCSSCKRIRNDDDQWEPVDVYLQRHDEISVSHGICPECASKLYPDLADALSPA